MTGNLHESRRAVLARVLSEGLRPRVLTLAADQISISRLALNVGYASFGGLDRVLRGESDPPLSVLLALAATFNLHSIDELFSEPGTHAALASLPVERVLGRNSEAS